jgi:type IV secretory pathway protease TraF
MTARALIGLGVAAALTAGLKALVLWFPKDRVPQLNGLRYFGPVSKCDILGVARPLWTWNPDG